jgi:hypothetical protein
MCVYVYTYKYICKERDLVKLAPHVPDLAHVVRLGERERERERERGRGRGREKVCVREKERKCVCEREREKGCVRDRDKQGEIRVEGESHMCPILRM